MEDGDLRLVPLFERQDFHQACVQLLNQVRSAEIPVVCSGMAEE